jgi:hypothetical protein
MAAVPRTHKIPKLYRVIQDYGRTLESSCKVLWKKLWTTAEELVILHPKVEEQGIQEHAANIHKSKKEELYAGKPKLIDSMTQRRHSVTKPPQGLRCLRATTLLVYIQARPDPLPCTLCPTS